MKETTGLLVEVEEGQFSFEHLTFQEYFAACYIWRNYGDSLARLWRLIKPYLLEPAWREVILLLIGKLGEQPHASSQIVKRLLENPDENEPLLRRYLRLATDCELDNVRLEVRLRERIVEEWVSVLRSPLCHQQGEMAWQALQEIIDRPNVRPRLSQFVDNSTELPRLRVQLAHMLTTNTDGSSPDISVLKRLALDSSLPREARLDALHFLLHDPLSETRAREMLTEFDEHDPDGRAAWTDAMLSTDWRTWLISQAETARQSGAPSLEDPLWPRPLQPRTELIWDTLLRLSRI